MTAFRVGLVLVLAITATVVANVALLGVATGSGEPVGRLTPQAGLVQAPLVRPPVQTTPAPPRVEPGDHSDD